MTDLLIDFDVDLDNTTLNVYEYAEQIRQRVYDTLSSFFTSIEPNWSSADVSFNDSRKRKLGRAVFNGPGTARRLS